MPNLVQRLVPQTVTDEMNDSLISMNEKFTAFFYNLTNENSKGLRTMAEGREGLARLISQIAMAHPEALSKTDDPKDLKGRLDYDAQLETMRQQLLKLNEQIEETQQANGVDIMQLADAYADFLQTNRKRNSALDEAMKPVDEWNKRFGRDQSGGTKTPEAPAS